ESAAELAGPSANAARVFTGCVRCHVRCRARLARAACRRVGRRCLAPRLAPVAYPTVPARKMLNDSVPAGDGTGIANDEGRDARWAHANARPHSSRKVSEHGLLH